MICRFCWTTLYFRDEAWLDSGRGDRCSGNDKGENENEDHVPVDWAQEIPRLIEKLDDTYDLVYISYDDELTDNQLRSVLAGNPSEAEESIMEWADDCRWHALTEYVLPQILSSSERDSLMDDRDAFEDLQEAIYERDTSCPFEDLLKNTSRNLMRYQVCHQTLGDLAGYDDEGYLSASAPDVIADLLGLEKGGSMEAIKQMAEIETMVANADGECNLYVIWYEEPADVAAPIVAHAWRGEALPTRITWDTPHLVLLNTGCGSGMDCSLDGPLSLPFDAEAVCLDKEDCGYGWDQTAGVVASAYSSSTTFDSPDLQDTTLKVNARLRRLAA